MIICVSTEHEKEAKEKGVKAGLIKRICIVALCFVLSLGTYILLPIEEETVKNYNTSGTEIVVAEGESSAYEMSFIPRHSYVKNVAPLLVCDDKEGTVELAVYKANKQLYSEKFQSTEDVIVSKNVKWHLKAGEEYVLRVSTEGVDAPVTLWIDSERTLSENTGSDMPMGISYTYHSPFTDKFSTLFYLIEWFCLYMTLGFALEILVKDIRDKR